MVRNFIYRCPTTGHNVQGSTPEVGEGQDHYIAETCLACGRVHLVNPATGKLMGEEVERREGP